MRPEIADLIRGSIYEKLNDSPNVLKYVQKRSWNAWKFIFLKSWQIWEIGLLKVLILFPIWS